jgi:hypothetical protein
VIAVTKHCVPVVRKPPWPFLGLLCVKMCARTGDSPRREKSWPLPWGAGVTPLQQLAPLQRSVSSAHPGGMIRQGQVVALALRADHLGLELVKHRDGGWAVQVPAGVVHGPCAWDAMVGWIAETEAERTAHASRVARARERQRVS